MQKCFTVSTSFSWISCISWICAQIPQIIENYKNKSASGISLGFLALWFLGDFLSFTSCLINDQVLRFQLYLSIFFLMNDITLCFQYFYYGDKPVYVEINEQIIPEVETFKTQPIEARTIMIESDSEPCSYDSTNDTNIMKKIVIGSSIISKASAFQTDSTTDSIGISLAWCMTVVYCLSRCPQLYKNYQRKAVDGISPFLFAAALVGNFSYTLCILTSCEFLNAGQRSSFIHHELPYIIGSSGTIIFDVGYFYQRYIYRKSVNDSIMVLENWHDIN